MVSLNVRQWIHCDPPQATAASWAAVRASSGQDPAVDAIVANDHRELLRHAEKLGGEYDYLVIDGPPRAAEVTR